MTILEMFDREDIYTILEKTLVEYYRNIYQKEVTVSVEKKHFFKKVVIYPRLGIVVPLFPSWAIIKRTYVSFDVQDNLPRKLFAWMYITLCFMTFGLLADTSLNISDESVYNKNIVIIPSNRKIRIYDYKNGYVDSILKDDFNDYYFKKEIEVRNSPKKDFILGLLSHGSRWYREKLLRGRCLVRCSGEEYENYLNQTLEDLKEFYADYIEEVKVASYVLEKQDKYRKLIEDISNKKHIKCADKLYAVLDKVAHICLPFNNDYFPTTLTHGDLQTGNIYIDEDNDKLYIIDWETMQRKSIWYDAATVLCATRRLGKFSEMINNRHDIEVTKKLLYFDAKQDRKMNLVAAILILEEMGFFLEEIVDLPGTMGSEIIERFEYEVDRINWKDWE